MEELEYRKGVLGIIIDSDNNFLIVNLVTYNPNEWNFPGGGREKDETAENALCRELKEELNIDKEDLEILGMSKQPIKYDFPRAMIENNIKHGRKYKGQIKEQFIVRFHGDKIKIQEEEIVKYKWVSFGELQKYLIFKNQYETSKDAIEEFLENIYTK
jgi:putative (di)nucleoside polyphosphate hydrolase